jgi:hypothetical protein
VRIQGHIKRVWMNNGYVLRYHSPGSFPLTCHWRKQCQQWPEVCEHVPQRVECNNGPGPAHLHGAAQANGRQGRRTQMRVARERQSDERAVACAAVNVDMFIVVVCSGQTWCAYSQYRSQVCALTYLYISRSVRSPLCKELRGIQALDSG